MTFPARITHCPDCGTPLTSESWARGMCLSCLARLAIDQPSLHDEIRAEHDAEAPTIDAGSTQLRPGQVLGNRYQIRSRLGGGGMGEVWRAFDLKLRVDVALKALHPRLLENERALETLRQEVRTAREVVSPNVCRVFQLEEVEGRELVSMEYVDGQTLTEVLRERSPLELDEAREIAAQFLAGLEAIHDAGLVHRDIKPENVMLTRAGRVVVMDFGIAKALATGDAQTVAGTPAYMSPEQSRGEPLDARADVFSAGIALAEMVAPRGVRTREARQELWADAREEPPRLEPTPWRRVLVRALASEKGQRYGSAAKLARALEEVTQRATDEEVQPYPGLAAFTAENASYFFGRELEVEELWRKLGRAHLLGLIGPSGAGKSSFLGAGLLSATPAGWCTLIAQPGDRPFANLAQPLARQLAGDAEAVESLVRFEDPEVALALLSRWRKGADQALVVVDQFEELFTQNPTEVQERFAELLARLSLDADVHVLLSMREDFLFRCQAFPPLRPLFSELTPLGPLTASGLRRALVQPALKCGYRFEDDELVDEMVGEVGDERGALPLVAFAAAQLWRRRDREHGLLTREAYEEIGGVGGALARHAETTLEQIGHDRLPVVRELFRHLVTAQGTRATWDREELLSTFSESEREEAKITLAALIDARLLTSYELETDDDQPTHHRVEVIHESLLRTWPRLVRWQSQDEDSAHLLDQLRQTAQLWEERGRPEDLLWAGTSFKEYELWRERYPGGLSTTEDSFADAMVAQAKRRQRRLRLAVSAAFVLLFAVLAVVGGLWRQALQEARRAEASKLLALGQSELDSDPREASPTTALAYATKSLELADEPTARRFVMEALWSGPLASRVDKTGGDPLKAVFSSDGEWLPTAGVYGDLAYLSRLDGHRARVPQPLAAKRDSEEPGWTAGKFLGQFAVPGSDLFLEVDAREFDVYRQPPDSPRHTWQRFATDGLAFPLDSKRVLRLERRGDQVVAEAWPIDGGEAEELGRLDETLFSWNPDGLPSAQVSGGLLASHRGNTGWVHDLAALDGGPVATLKHDSPVLRLVWGEAGRRLTSVDEEGHTHVWEPRSGREEPVHSLRASPRAISLDPRGTALALSDNQRPYFEIRDLAGPPEASPLILHRRGLVQANYLTFDRTGHWLVSAGLAEGWVRDFWQVDRRYPYRLEGHDGTGYQLSFSPDGEWLASAGKDGTLRLWPMSPQTGSGGRVLARLDSWLYGVAWHPMGRLLLISKMDSPCEVYLVDVATGALQQLDRAGEWTFAKGLPVPVAFSPDGRLAAAFGQHHLSSQESFRTGDGLWSGPLVWDVESGELLLALETWQRDREPGENFNPLELTFSADGRHLISAGSHIRIWDLEKGTSQALGKGNRMALIRDGRRLLVSDSDGLRVQDLEEGSMERLPHHQADVIALDPSESILVRSVGDEVRVGPLAGGEPHRLLGHEGAINGLDVSPDGRWIASVGDDGVVRVWPMPDVTKPPFHTLPYDELLETLRKLTNFRAAPDPESDTGYSIDYAPFAGWADYPEWYPVAPEVKEARLKEVGESTSGPPP